MKDPLLGVLMSLKKRIAMVLSMSDASMGVAAKSTTGSAASTDKRAEKQAALEILLTTLFDEIKSVFWDKGAVKAKDRVVIGVKGSSSEAEYCNAMRELQVIPYHVCNYCSKLYNPDILWFIAMFCVHFVCF